MVTAFVLGTVKEIHKIEEILKDLMRIDEIKEANKIYGDYDVIVKVLANDLDHMNDTIVNKLRAVEGLGETNTLISL